MIDDEQPREETPENRDEEPKITVRREVVKISGDRNLYRYEFEIEPSP